MSHIYFIFKIDGLRAVHNIVLTVLKYQFTKCVTRVLVDAYVTSHVDNENCQRPRNYLKQTSCGISKDVSNGNKYNILRTMYKLQEMSFDLSRSPLIIIIIFCKTKNRQVVDSLWGCG